MDRKELVQRWRNALGYGQKEMFYYPVKDNKSKGDFSPMILEIEVSVEEGKVKCEFYSYNNNCSLNIFNTDSNGVINKSITFPITRPFYNLKTVDGKKISLQEFKNILKETYSFEYNVYDHIELLYEEYDPFLKIDWGDGNVEDYSEQINVSTQSVTINDITYNYDYISSTGIKSHTYTESGRYIVKINANLPSLYGLMKMNSSSETAYCDVKRLIKWGNLHLRTPQRMFSNSDTFEYIQPISELVHNELYYILNANSMFYNVQYNIMDILGESNLKNMPNLIYSTEMFAYCSFETISDDFFMYNTKLNNISQMFSNNSSLISVGNNVFANLLYIQNASYCFYMCSNLQTVGDSLFENDVNLNNPTSLFYTENSHLKTVGDNLFKNCLGMITSGSIFNYCSRLKTVGQNMFENCYALKSVRELFHNCISLETVGTGLFKNCYNICDAQNLFYNCMKVTVPDRLFYDLKCDDTNYNSNGYNSYYNKNVRLNCQNMFYSNTKFSNYVQSPENNTVEIYSYTVNGDAEDLKLEYYSYDFDTFPYITLGKEMFSPQFVSDLKTYNALISISSFQSMTTRRKYVKDDDYNSDIYATSIKGEAFPIWENPEVFACSQGIYGYTEMALYSSGSSWISHKPQLDNVDLIPLPKMYKYVYEGNNGYTYYMSSVYDLNKHEFIYLNVGQKPNSGYVSWDCEFEEVEN